MFLPVTVRRLILLNNMVYSTLVCKLTSNIGLLNDVYNKHRIVFQKDETKENCILTQTNFSLGHCKILQ